jgi:hypothetical protein
MEAKDVKGLKKKLSTALKIDKIQLKRLIQSMEKELKQEKRMKIE